jgi:hypothetical protein
MGFDDSVVVVLALGAHRQANSLVSFSKNWPWHGLFLPVMYILQHVFL